MRNEYIYETKLQLDIDYLKHLVLKDNNTANLAKHHRLVETDAYMSNIRKKFPFLSHIYNVYNHVPGRIVETHIDANRHCALNIPVFNTQDSYTIFYKKDDLAQSEFDDKKILFRVTSPVSEAFRFTLNLPTLLNTTYPHSVINYGDQERTIISWSILKPILFMEACDLLSDDAVGGTTLETHFAK